MSSFCGHWIHGSLHRFWVRPLFSNEVHLLQNTAYEVDHI